MKDEFHKRIADRFTGFELIEYLGISVEEVINAFEGEIDDAREELEEFVNYGR